MNIIDSSKYYNSFNLLMQLILFPIPFCHKLTHQDWKQLFDCMDTLYNNSLSNWLKKYTNLSEEEIALCYFCRIGIKHVNLAIFFSISPQSLSKRKQRLKDKLGIPHSMSLEDVIGKI